MKKSKTLFFSHDYNARNDPKLRILRGQHGSVGMDFYWCLIEALHEQGGTANTLCVRAIAADLGIKQQDAANDHRNDDGSRPCEQDPRGSRDECTCGELLQDLSEYRAGQSEHGRRGAAKRNAALANPKGTPNQPSRVPQAGPQANESIVDKSKENNNTHTQAASVPEDRASVIARAKEITAAKNKPTWEAFDAYTQMRGYPQELADAYWKWMDGRGWLVGEAGLPIGSWRSHYDAHMDRKVGANNVSTTDAWIDPCGWLFEKRKEHVQKIARGEYLGLEYEVACAMAERKKKFGPIAALEEMAFCGPEFAIAVRLQRRANERELAQDRAWLESEKRKLCKACGMTWEEIEHDLATHPRHEEWRQEQAKEAEVFRKRQEQYNTGVRNAKNDNERYQAATEKWKAMQGGQC